MAIFKLKTTKLVSSKKNKDYFIFNRNLKHESLKK